MNTIAAEADGSATIAIVLAVTRTRIAAGPIEGAPQDLAVPATPVASVPLEIPCAGLTAPAQALLRHLTCLSPLETESVLLVDSHVDAATIYRHNARLALARDGHAPTFLREHVRTMAEWDADFAQYCATLADAERRRLDLPMRHTWQWTVYEGATGTAEHVNRETEAVLAFGRPAMTNAGLIDFPIPEEERALRCRRLRAFAAGEEPVA